MSAPKGCEQLLLVEPGELNRRIRHEFHDLVPDRLGSARVHLEGDKAFTFARRIMIRHRQRAVDRRPDVRPHRQDLVVIPLTRLDGLLPANGRVE